MKYIKDSIVISKGAFSISYCASLILEELFTRMHTYEPFDKFKAKRPKYRYLSELLVDYRSLLNLIRGAIRAQSSTFMFTWECDSEQTVLNGHWRGGHRWLVTYNVEEERVWFIRTHSPGGQIGSTAIEVKELLNETDKTIA